MLLPTSVSEYPKIEISYLMDILMDCFMAHRIDIENLSITSVCIYSSTAGSTILVRGKFNGRQTDVELGQISLDAPYKSGSVWEEVLENDPDAMDRIRNMVALKKL